MKQLLFTTVLGCIATINVFSQTNFAAEKDQAGLQKFYFPARFYSDSEAFENQMPKLTEQVLATYKEKNKRNYFETAATYNLITGNYQKAADCVDSVQMIA